MRWYHSELERFKAAYDNGDRMAVIWAAVHIATMADDPTTFALPWPAWVLDALIHEFQQPATLQANRRRGAQALKERHQAERERLVAEITAICAQGKSKEAAAAEYLQMRNPGGAHTEKEVAALLRRTRKRTKKSGQG